MAARAGWTVPDLASACLDGGARFLQIRAKGAAGQWLLDASRAVVASAAPAGALVVVNDRADIARMAGAGGAHVGQDDLSPRAARAVVEAQATIGLSTHTPAQVIAGRSEPVDYLAIGPIFETGTKDTGYRPLGLRGIANAIDLMGAGGLPLVAIGGMTVDRAAEAIRAGAAAVAVIGDIVVGKDPAARVRAYLAALEG